MSVDLAKRIMAAVSHNASYRFTGCTCGASAAGAALYAEAAKVVRESRCSGKAGG
jgi:hypothetical protein